MINEAVKGLFIECFPDTEKEADLILGFAEKYGRIYTEYINGTLVNIICTAPIRDENFYAEYIFACGTKKEYRGQGIFRRRLNEVTGNTPALLIPENDSLYPMYESLGFTPLYCLEAFFGGDGRIEECTESLGSVYEAYKSSTLYPKKSPELFRATADAFLSYGNAICCVDGAFLFVQNGTATEIIARNGQSAINAARRCKKALLGSQYEKALKENGIPYSKKPFAMAKNLNNPEGIYINNLFN